MAAWRIVGPAVGVLAGFAAGWIVFGWAPPAATYDAEAVRDAGGTSLPPSGAPPRAMPGAREPAPDPAPSPGAPQGPAAPAPALPAPESPDRPPTVATARAPAAEPVTDSPLFEEMVAERARRIRQGAQHQEQTADAVARAQVLHEIETERARRVDLERGGTMAFLRELGQKWVPPVELASDPAQFGRLFERRTRGATVNGATLTAETEIRDGDRIVFGSGLHRLPVKAWNRRPSFPQDVTIEGSGMDATCLVLDEPLRLRGDVHALGLRDLTVHCNDNPLAAMQGPFTLRIERCRLVGFDSGAGGSNMIGGGVGALWMTESRIEAGFGRHPDGNLFDVRGAFVVRLGDCDVVGPFNSVHDRSARVTHVYVRCRFRVLPERLREWLERAANVLAVDCSFQYEEHAPLPRPERRPLTDINSAWS